MIIILPYKNLCHFSLQVLNPFTAIPAALGMNMSFSPGTSLAACGALGGKLFRQLRAVVTGYFSSDLTPLSIGPYPRQLSRLDSFTFHIPSLPVFGTLNTARIHPHGALSRALSCTAILGLPARPPTLPGSYAARPACIHHGSFNCQEHTAKLWHLDLVFSS